MRPSSWRSVTIASSIASTTACFSGCPLLKFLPTTGAMDSSVSFAAGNAVSLAGHPLLSWRFQVPGYTGDGSYDLAAIPREREPRARRWPMRTGTSSSGH
jgi:hypothetical protein